MLAVVIFVCAILIGCNVYYSDQSEERYINPNEKVKKLNK